MWVACRALGVLGKVHIGGWRWHLGGSFVAVNVEMLLYGQGLIFLLVLVSFNVMEFKAKGVQLLNLVMNFCKDWVVIMDGFSWVWCVLVSIYPGNNTTIVAVDVYNTRSGNREWVESCVLAEETEQHVDVICLCQAGV